MGYGYGGGCAVSRYFATRRTRSASSVGGKAPVPKAAERLRSSTEVLLPSQCSCIPLRGPWCQIDGKSELPCSSFGSTDCIGKFRSAFALLNVSTRPGPADLGSVK